MTTALSRVAPSALVLGLAGAAATVAGCEGCPDLWYQAFEFEVTGEDRTHIFLTATEQGTGEIPCNDRALAENCLAGPGVYDLSFELAGNVIGELQGVCTLGDQDGCAAEDAEAQGPPPLVSIDLDPSTGDWHVTLEREGPCP